MTPSRRTEVTLRKLVAQGGITKGVDGEPMLVGGVTQVEALAALRQMPQSRTVELADVDYSDDSKEAHYARFNQAMLAVREENAAKNARKRARRARR